MVSASFNSLFEVQTLRPGHRPAYRVLPFNSLFEMRVSAHVTVPGVGQTAFNSLFEMLDERTTRMQTQPLEPAFNSLFEMLCSVCGRRPATQRLSFSLSILYLRCRNKTDALGRC